MLEKTQFVIKNYATLFLLMLVFWGMGQTIIKFIGSVSGDKWIDMAMACTFGLGIFILFLQILAVNGHLQRANLNIWIFAGLLFACFHIALAWKTKLVKNKTSSDVYEINTSSWFGFCLIALALVPTFISPFIPPNDWDELMYHLPHANQWAETGRLTVNEWLRYPWFPYNFNLLYAAALILRGDILTHLLHASAGWIVALMVYRIGIRYSSRGVATIATLMWLILVKDLFSNAYVELGVTLFITTASVACLFWIENPARRGWLLITAFMLGLAAGSKYQALTFVPFFCAVVIFRDRRISSMALAATVFLLPCLYWYARNALVTGDPFNPLGAKLFGFYDWNLQDYEWQVMEIKRVTNWPKEPLWPLLLIGFFKPWRQSRALRSAFFFGFYAMFVWYFTSHYDRYLVPAMPVLALLSAWTLAKSGVHVNINIKKLIPWFIPIYQRYSLIALGGLVFVLALIFSVSAVRKVVPRVALTDQQRGEFLRQNIVAYDLLMQLRQQTNLKIYQFGLEGVIYYGPSPMWGEIFGPWRYSDLSGLSVSALSSNLRMQGFNTLLIRNEALAPFLQQEEFNKYFQHLFLGNGAQAYRIIDLE